MRMLMRQVCVCVCVQEMTEEQELALALQMSLQGAGMTGLLEQAMETDSGTVAADGGEAVEVGGSLCQQKC